MKFNIKTLGCKLNFYESEKLENYLLKKNYIKSEKDADFIIINSCAVTKKAIKKTIKICRKQKLLNKNAKIITFGCGIKIYKNEIKNETDFLFRDLNLCINFFKEKVHVFQTFSKNSKKHGPLTPKIQKVKKYIKIQKGCDNFCSFCVVCLSRGKSINRDTNKIINEIKEAENIGYKEINLTGINIMAFGCKNTRFKNETKIANLLKKILDETKINRIRLSSINVQYINKDFLEIIKNKRICKHFHLSIQHTNDFILKKMNRNYTNKDIKKSIKNLKKIDESVCISCDLICGFPYENEKIFDEFLEDIKKLEIDKIHCFPFSSHKITKASTFPQNKKNEIIMRNKKMLSLAKEKWKSFLQRNINKKREILFETENHGHTKNYVPIHIQAEKNMKNKIIIKKIKKENICW